MSNIVVLHEMNKKYFRDLVDTLGAKLKELPVNSYIRSHFPASRLEQMSRKIEESHCKDLEWDYWQPFFLFLKNADVAVIQALESDLQMVMARTSSRRVAKLVAFLNDEQVRGSSWLAGLFETFVKAAFLKNEGVSVSALDWDLPNQRNIDVKLQIGEREFCVECTTMGDSEADKTRWEKHCEKLKAEPNACLCDSKDAYTQGRRLFGKVYDKIAGGFDLSKSQLCPEAPNLLLISFTPLLGDLTPTSPSIGWALDELFRSQPTGNGSNVSLQSWLNRQEKKDNLEDLLAAPRQLSGILLFSGCTLAACRINYNAEKRISHIEMELIEKLLAQQAVYCC